VKYRCIIAPAREEYQVGRFPLLLFQDNPFVRQNASLCDGKYDYINPLLHFLLPSSPFFSDSTIIIQDTRRRTCEMFHETFIRY